jgi:lysophospholipase L1-like esterase
MTNIVMPGVNLAEALRPHGRRLVVIGDSQSALTSPAVHDAKRWWVWALAIDGWRYDLAGLSAAAGRSTAAMVANFAEVTTLIDAGGPIDEAWICAGSNDVANADTAIAGIAAFDTLTQLCRDAGITRIRALSVLPRPAAAMSADVQRGMIVYNRGLADRSRRGEIELIDAGAAIRDLDAADGSALSGMLADLVHPNALGALRIGSSVAAAIAGAAAPLDDFAAIGADTYALHPGLSRQLLDNPLLAGSGGTNDGGASGTLPTGWHVGYPGAAIAGAVAASTDTLPRQRRWQQVTFSGGLSALSYFGVLIQWVFNVDSKGIAAGTALRARLSVRAAGLSANFKDLPFQLWFFDAAYGILSTAACLAETGTGAGELPASLTLEIPKAVVPVNCKHIAFRLDASFAAGACAGTIAVSEPQLSILS